MTQGRQDQTGGSGLVTAPSLQALASLQADLPSGSPLAERLADYLLLAGALREGEPALALTGARDLAIARQAVLDAAPVSPAVQRLLAG